MKVDLLSFLCILTPKIRMATHVATNRLTIRYISSGQRFTIIYVYDNVNHTMTLTKGTEVLRLEHQRAMYDYFQPGRQREISDTPPHQGVIDAHFELLPKKLSDLGAPIESLENTILTCLMVNDNIINAARSRLDGAEFIHKGHTSTLKLQSGETVKFPGSGTGYFDFDLLTFLRK